MNALDRKLLRDFRRLWAQALAIALVAAAGVMTLLVGIGTYRALYETRTAYYDRYAFADVFATAIRAPNSLTERILAIPGVSRIDTRVQSSAVLDIPGLVEPASGLVLSIPDRGEPVLNKLVLMDGKLPAAGEPDSVVISQAFAEANGFAPGDSFSATMGGVKRTLSISGIVLSPEYIYSIGPGQMVPDNRRFGIIWMRYAEAAAIFDLNGAFNSVSIKLARGASESGVVEALDSLLKPYGGRGAHGRSQQVSYAFLDSELVQLEGMSATLPPIFLAVAAFLVNMTLARLVALEREQIGLLKALGYGSFAIAWHYVKLSLLIASAGVLIGWVVGAWATHGMAALYAEFYKFPFLLFQISPDTYAISGGAALLAAVLGSLQAVMSAARLSPAVAMAPPAPTVYKRFILDRLGVTRYLPQGINMALRSMIRRPLRAFLTLLGISLSSGLVVSGLFVEDSLDYMLDAQYFHAQREQATVGFAHPVTPRGLESVSRLPGVIKVEPMRAVAVKFYHGTHTRLGSIEGKPNNADLDRVIDKNLNPVSLPPSGLALSNAMAKALNARVGDKIEAHLLDGSGKILTLPVTDIVQQFIGLGANMDITALNRALGQPDYADGAYLLIDTDKTDALYAAIKAAPGIASVSLAREALYQLRKQVGENLGINRTIFVTLAVIIVFGVVYNTARIQLSEQARELASLRVLGFTKFEVSIVLLTEVGLLTLLSLPLGWVVGYWASAGMLTGVSSDLFTFPLVIYRSTYAWATIVTIVAALISAVIVQRRVAGLDMIAVLKTRD